MLLKSLKLENIRSYTSENIDFTQGSSLLLGDIGSGKTTILLGIEFALFGLIKGDVSGTTLLRHGKKDGLVELNFELDGKDITISRRLKRKADTVMQDAGYMIIDDKRIDATPVELKSKILELFGYPPELLSRNTSLIYRYTVYTPQEEMKAILFETKEERLDTLRRIFNIDKYKRIRENALNYTKELRNTRKILESKVQDLDQRKLELDERKKQQAQLSAQLDASSKAVQESSKAVAEKTAAIRDSEKKISELTGLKKDHEIAKISLANKKSESDRLTKELSMAGFRIKDYSAKLESLGPVEQDEEKLKLSLADAEDKLTKINVAKQTVKERLETREKELKDIIIDDSAALRAREQELSKLIETRPQKEKEREDTTKSVDKMKLELNTMRLSTKNSHRLMDQLKDMHVCPTCLQQVDLSHVVKITDRENASIIECDRKIAELEKRCEESDKRTKELAQEIENIRRSELELKDVRFKLETLGQRIETKQRLEKEIEELKAKQDKLDNMDVGKLIEIISKYRKMASSIAVKKTYEDALAEKRQQKADLDERIRQNAQELAAYSARCREIEEKISSYADIEKDYIQKREDLELSRAQLHQKEMELSSIRKDNEIMNAEIKRLADEIDTKSRVREKIAYISELNFWINEHFVSLTSTIEKAIMSRVQQEFNELFKKWFDILMDNEDMDVRIDEEFTPIVEQNGYETETLNLSGGEKTAVALSYRLALNKVINDFISTIKTKDIIILDEPTDGFSSEQLDKMREVFDELSIGQMIIVSHEAKMESYVEHIIRVAKNDHNSKILI